MWGGATSGRAVLRRVGLRGAARDGLRARQRLERALAGVTWSPPGFPSAALLVVRAIEADGTLGVRPFQRSVYRQIEALAGRARRPWIHDDAAHADAVWFAVEAELVACLVRDWLAGRMRDRWWWAGVWCDVAPRDLFRRQVLARGDLFVPVIAALASRGSAGAWIARLEEAEVVVALRAVCHAYAVPDAGVDDATPPLPLDPARTDARIGTKSDAAAVRAARRGRVARVVPEAFVPELRGARRRLLALALATVRAPSWVRTPEWHAAWSDLEDEPEHASLVAPVVGSDARPRLRPEARVVSESLDSASSHASGGARRASGDGDGRGGVATAPIVDEARGGPVSVGPDEPVESTRAVRPRVPSYTSAAPAAPLLDPLPVDEVTCPEPLAEPSARERRVEPLAPVATQFASIFYLINMALALGLYGDFTAPRAAGLALLPWDLLALVGRSWFGRTFVADPVWDLLAGLAGRTRADEPGATFEAPREWRVDESWLGPWGDVGAVRRHTTRTRIRLRHRAGFALQDRPRGSSAVSIARARGAWLRCLLDYMRARLARALDLPPRDAVASVCRQRGTIAVTPSSVTVTMDLATLPLAVRFAGLDRDAGWIPAAGRALRFEFR